MSLPQVTNMSFGQRQSSPSLARAAAALEARNILLVAAAGNGGPREPVDFPARYPQVLAVTAVDRRNRLALSASRGPEVDLAAPGMRILSLWPGDRLRLLSGSSMAAAHVTGAAALLLAADPGLTPAAVRERLRETAEPIPGLSRPEQGAGLVRADRALTGNAEPEEPHEPEQPEAAPPAAEGSD